MPKEKTSFSDYKSEQPTPKIVVIGAGAAGLMAAGQAASFGIKTILLEKMPKPALKLGITGKGRCNFTNSAKYQDFIAHFQKKSRKFLYPSLSNFSNHDLIHFFQNLGLESVEQRGGRIFPATERAQDLVKALTDWIRKKNINLYKNTQVQSLLIHNGIVNGVLTEGKDDQKREIQAEAVILATGGSSYPATGSSGEGYKIAAMSGHTINPVYPGLVPLETFGKTAACLQGLSLRNIQVTAWVENKKIGQDFGEMVFTDFGLSGPAILTLSSLVTELLDQGKKVEFSIDLKPGLDHKKLDHRLLREFEDNGKKHLINILANLLPQKMIPVCLEQTGLSSHKTGNQITSKERQRLRNWLKDFKWRIRTYRSFEEAIITLGGISIKEINPNDLSSKLISGLYFAGEVLDIAGDTGGFNLQAAFSTGWLAGRSAARHVIANQQITPD